MDDPRLGSVLGGRYRIDARLAAGGSGIVYYATQLGLDRSVAVKFLHQSSAQSMIQQGRFEREARVMSKLGHPNIAAIIDFGSDDDSPYLVMELCKGRPLRDVIAEGALEPRRATHIARQILAGLAHAHDAHIVHRDLKPGNVLLLDSLGEDHLKILDFGVAKIMSSDGPTELSVAASGPLGTPHYMSPEQAMSEAVDSRTDLYSLGIILYEMTTGKRPFDSGAGYALLRQHVEDTPQRPRQLCDISAKLESVILRALEKAPEDRFQTAAEMMDALAQVPEMAGPSSSGRRRVLWTSFALVGLGGLAYGGWYGAEQGWYQLPWSERSGLEQAALVPIDAAPEIDSGQDKAQEETIVRDPIPAWVPAPAAIELAVETPFPNIGNEGLRGMVAGQRFEPLFAVLVEKGGSTRLRFATRAPERPVCSGLANAEMGAEVSLTLPSGPLRGESLSSDRGSEITFLDGEAESVLKARWNLKFATLDVTEGTVTARFDLRGRKTRLSGEFVAGYCPDLGDDDAGLPRVNGVVWNPDRAPVPNTLPQRAVAGAFGDIGFQPAQVHLSNPGGGVRTALTFFAEVPAEPCSTLGASDVGAIVSVPGTEFGEQAFTALLPGDPTTTPWATFQFGNDCEPSAKECMGPAHVEASVVSLQVDSTYAGELRGRIYLAAADRRRTLLVGAFRAHDCRSRWLEPVNPMLADGDAGAIVGDAGLGADDAGLGADDAGLDADDAGLGADDAELDAGDAGAAPDAS